MRILQVVICSLASRRWREFYANLPRPAQVGIEASGSMQWFVNLMEELGIECLVAHPAEIRAAEPGNKSVIGEMRTSFYHF